MHWLIYDLKHVVGAEGSPQWDGSSECAQGLFELMDMIISPDCPIPSQFSCYVMDARENRLIWSGSFEIEIIS